MLWSGIILRHSSDIHFYVQGGIKAEEGAKYHAAQSCASTLSVLVPFISIAEFLGRGNPELWRTTSLADAETVGILS